MRELRGCPIHPMVLVQMNGIQIRESYRDLVKVWHPDRFAHDPKLQQKAEEKLKEINLAYQAILDYLKNLDKNYRPAGGFTNNQNPQDNNGDWQDIEAKLKEIFIEKNITDKDQLQELKNIISAWSNNIPEHDLLNFGDRIEFLTIRAVPSYKIQLRTQYEKREVIRIQESYKGENILPKEVDENNVDVWSYNVSLTENFEKNVQTYAINNSKEVFTCSSCKGHGKVVCIRCRGNGKIECDNCKGHGGIKCHICGGAGQRRCADCNGSGHRGQQRCSSCAGTGHKTCSTCGGRGERTCSKCKGRGEIVCSKCNGKGDVVCGSCEGYGKIVSYLAFKDIFEPEFNNELISYDNVPSEIISGDSIHIYNDVSSPQKLIDDDGSILLDIVRQQIPQDYFNSVTYENLRKTLVNLLISSKESKKLGIIGKDCRILKQKLCLKRIDIFEIKYKYSGKEYQLYIYGTNRKIFAPISPISEVRQGYLDSVNDLYKKKEYLAALETVGKAVKMNPKDEYSIKLRKQILSKINRPYLIGGAVGGALAGSLMAFSLFTFISGFYDFLLIIGASVFGFFTGYFFKWKYSFKIRNEKKRFVYPSVVGFIVSFAIFVIIMNMLPADKRAVIRKAAYQRGLMASQAKEIPISDNKHTAVSEALENNEMKNIADAVSPIASQTTPKITDAEYRQYIKASVDFKKSESDLNTVYKELLAILHSNEKEELKQSQREWIKTRDDEAFKAAPKGSAAYIATLVKITNDRAAELKSRLQ
ncbi:MAG: lysozyme inhibitor LprI family protein [Nitrospiraceae bacterium]|nr:lysozyme inhibitor LprI family protein [Nitrospiraceae bacterium]